MLAGECLNKHMNLSCSLFTHMNELSVILVLHSVAWRRGAEGERRGEESKGEDGGESGEHGHDPTPRNLRSADETG